VDVARLTSAGFPARVGGRDDSGHSNTSVNAYTGAKLGNLDVEIGHWQTRAKAEYYDFFLNPVSHDLFNSVTGVTLKAPVTSWWAMSIKPSEMYAEIDQNQSSDYSHTRRHTLDWQNDFQLGRNDLLTLGAYRAREHTAALSFGDGYREQSDSWAAFVQNQWKPGNNSLLTALRYSDYDGFDPHTTGEIAYGYRFGPVAQLFVSTATGFRAPDSTDRFGYGGNPDLLPERSKHAELGARLQPAPAHRLNLQAFWNEIDNLINCVDPDGFGGPTPCMNQNIDRARIRGIELGYRYNQGPWRLNAEGISQDPENLDTHRQLARRAARSLTVGGGYSSKSYSLAVNVLAQDSRWDSDFSSTRLPAYALVNLLGDYRIAPDWTLGVRIENLFNEPYTLAETYNTAGRTYFLDLRYRRALHKARSE
jgi:vitamin B12 transporter